jgi:hypothetical protein
VRRALAEAREARDRDPRAPDDPQRGLPQPRVDDVVQRRVLQPARQRVEPDAAAGRRVGQAGDDGLLEQAALTGMGDDLVEGGGAHALPN